MSWFRGVLMTCNVCARLWSRGLREKLAGACHLVPSQLSSLLPTPALVPSSPKMPAGSRLHAGEKSWSGASLLLATILGRSLPFPLPLPHQLQSVAMTDVSPAAEEERSQRALDLTWLHTCCVALPRDCVPRCHIKAPIIGVARDKQSPREMDIPATLI